MSGIRTTCGDNPRLGIVGCGAAYAGNRAHSVARVAWSTQPDGRAHLTFSTPSAADKCWKGDTMRHPSAVGLVERDGLWGRPGQRPGIADAGAQGATQTGVGL